MNTKYKCPRCGHLFNTPQRFEKHYENRHANGALWIDGNLTIWRESDIKLGDDFKYWAICELHAACSGFTNKKGAMSVSLDDFCEACNGTAKTGDYSGYVAPVAS